MSIFKRKTVENNTVVENKEKSKESPSILKKIGHFIKATKKGIYITLGLALPSALSAMPGNTVLDNVESLNSSNFDIEGLDLSNGGGTKNYEKININGKTVELISTAKGLAASVNGGVFRLVSGPFSGVPSSKLVPTYDANTHEKSYVLLGHVDGSSATSQINLSVDANDNVTATTSSIGGETMQRIPLNDCYDKTGSICAEKTYVIGGYKANNPTSSNPSDYIAEDMSPEINDTAIGLDDGRVLYIAESSRWDDADMVFIKASKDATDETYALDPTTQLPGAALQNRFYNVTDLAKEENVTENGCNVTKVYVFRQGKLDHSIHEIVTLTYTGEGACTVTCDNDTHLENSSCVPNSKEVACNTDNANPLNSYDLSEDVTVVWNPSTETWSVAADCAWACNNDFHKTADQTACESDSKTVQCIDNAPEGAVSVTEDVEVQWVNGQWEVTPDCAWSCNNTHHQEGDDCILNTRTVSCNAVTIENGTSIDRDVEITYSPDGWSNPEDCDFDCNEGYHKTDDGSACEMDTETEKSVPCDDSNVPENADAIQSNVTIKLENGAWTDPAGCEWSCSENYHLNENGDLCDSNNKLVPCDDSGISENEVIMDDGNENQVTVVWDSNTKTWSEPAACPEQCAEGYERDGNNVCALSSEKACNAPEEMYNQLKNFDKSGDIETKNNVTDYICTTKQAAAAYEFIRSEISINGKKLSEVNSLNEVLEYYIYAGLRMTPVFEDNNGVSYLSNIVFENISDEPITIGLDTNKDGDDESIILDAGRKITLNILANIKNNNINNLDTEYTLGSTWIADMPNGYRVIKTGEKIDIKLPTEGDGSTYTMLGGVGTDYAVETAIIKALDGTKFTANVYTARKTDEGSYVYILNLDTNGNVVSEKRLVPNENFKTVSLDAETGEVYLNGAVSKDWKVNLATGEITKAPNSVNPNENDTISDGGCTFNPNSSPSNQYVWFMLMGLLGSLALRRKYSKKTVTGLERIKVLDAVMMNDNESIKSVDVATSNERGKTEVRVYQKVKGVKGKVVYTDNIDNSKLK